jgi:hypothetical protein
LIPALHLLYFFWAQGRTLIGLFWTQGRTVELERNGTDWAKGRTEILNWIGLLVWVGRQVEVEESCGIFFWLVLSWSTRREGFEGRSAGLHKITYSDPTPEHTRGDRVLWIFG